MLQHVPSGGTYHANVRAMLQHVLQSTHRANERVTAVALLESGTPVLTVAVGALPAAVARLPLPFPSPPAAARPPLLPPPPPPATLG